MEINSIYRCLYNSYNYNNNDTNRIDHYSHNKEIKSSVDLSDDFPKIYDQSNYGITSSCSIVSVISYYKKKYNNINILLSPYFLSYQQYLITKCWNQIDILTGLNVSNQIGICSEELFPNILSKENKVLDCDYILIDASHNKLNYYSKIKFNINNIINCLNDLIPIICSIKIIPSCEIPIPSNLACYSTINKTSINCNEISINFNKELNFFDYLNNTKYWENVNKYYQDDTIIYSVSIVIVGYNNNNKQLKIRGCWGDQVGDNGYFYINYQIIEKFNNLFFDTYIVDTKSSLNKNTNIELTNDYLKKNIKNNIDNINNNNTDDFLFPFKQLPINEQDEYIDETKYNTFILEQKIEKYINPLKKVSSRKNISELTIEIEDIDEVYLLLSKKMDNIVGLNI